MPKPISSNCGAAFLVDFSKASDKSLSKRFPEGCDGDGNPCEPPAPGELGATCSDLSPCIPSLECKALSSDEEAPSECVVPDPVVMKNPGDECMQDSECEFGCAFVEEESMEKQCQAEPAGNSGE
ncbi:hypothetical protein TWF694_005532 [Orbilia ellipsospora]|uniref:Uncharacterized protein n=1 Tax=Orbilia ellipsospora TaxID=2528407 RepID=A0AAV9WTL6_9PEZI